MTTIHLIVNYVARLTAFAGRATKLVRSFHILKLASAICTQFASLYLVYLLDPIEYGKFALIATFAQLMFILTSGWSNGALINLGSQSFARTGSYKDIVYYRLCIVTVAFVLINLVLIPARPVIEEYAKISSLYPYVLALFVGYVLYDHGSQLLYPGNHNQMQAAAEFVTTLILLIAVSFVVKDVRSYIFVYAVVSAVFASVISIIFFRFFHKHPFQWKQQDFEKVFNYSAWQMISIICIYIINMGSNYILIFYEAPLEQIGLYNFSYRLYSGFAPFFSLFGILIPKWIHSSNISLRSIEKNILIIVVALVMLYLASVYILESLLQLLHMQRYFGSVRYFFWLFPAFMFTSYSNLLNTVIANTDSFRLGQVGIFLQSVLLIICNFIFVPKFGVEGVVVSMVLASFIGAVYFKKIYSKVKFQVSV